MANNSLSQEKLKKVNGGLTSEQAQLLTTKLMEYYHQGRLGVDQFQIIKIKEFFEIGDETEIENIFSKYDNNNISLAWTGLHNIYNTMKYGNQ